MIFAATSQRASQTGGERHLGDKRWRRRRAGQPGDGQRDPPNSSVHHAATSILVATGVEHPGSVRCDQPQR